MSVCVKTKDRPALSIGDGYLLDHGFVMKTGWQGHSYNPLGYPQVAGDFAKLHDGDDKALLEFCGSWGLPRLPVRVGPEYDQLTTGEKSAPPGEAAWIIWRHASNARLVLQLLHYLQTKNPPGLSKFLSGFERVRDDGGVETRIVYCVGREVTAVTDQLDMPERVARKAVVTIIDRNLTELEGYFNARLDTAPFELVLICSELLPAIYWHLAHTAAEGVLRRCTACDEVLIVTDMRQRYCPPPPQWAGGVESVCASRARRQRYARMKDHDS